MKQSSGRIWPYIIGVSITLVFGFCVATIVITDSSNIQESNTYMTYYQDADLNANKLIQQRILFDKKYTISFVSKSIAGENPLISYKITNKQGIAVDNAKINIFISRPETTQLDQKLKNPSVNKGIYIFKDAIFSKEGLYNIIAKIVVGDNVRFYNIKADTRNSNTYEF